MGLAAARRWTAGGRVEPALPASSRLRGQPGYRSRRHQGRRTPGCRPAAAPLTVSRLSGDAVRLARRCGAAELQRLVDERAVPQHDQVADIVLVEPPRL